MEARKVGIGHGWLWIKQGFSLILRNPILSVVLAGIMAAILFLILKIPGVGPLLMPLLFPALMAGYMKACRAMDMNEEADIAHLAAGFGKHAPRLLALGGVLLAGVFLVPVLMTAIGGDAFLTFMEKAQEINDPAAMNEALQAVDPAVFNALLAGLVLYFLLSVCLQFSPMLVLFDDEKPLAAIKSSLVGTWRNALPYTIYSLLLFPILYVISLLHVVIFLVLLLTLSMTTLYSAYRDIYSRQQARAEPVTPRESDPPN